MLPKLEKELDTYMKKDKLTRDEALDKMSWNFAKQHGVAKPSKVKEKALMRFYFLCIE